MGLVVVGILVVGLIVVGLLVVSSLVVGLLVVGSLVVGWLVVGSMVECSYVLGSFVVGSLVSLRDGLNVGLRVVGLEVIVGLLVVCFDVGLHVRGSVFGVILVIVIRNQLMFQPPPIALMPNAMGPAFRLTVCEIVCQFCQPPVF